MTLIGKVSLGICRIRYVMWELQLVGRIEDKTLVPAEFLLEILLGKRPVGRLRRRGFLKISIVQFGDGWN
jgi:hypothetical protein